MIRAVDLRLPPAPGFGDDFTREQFEAQCLAARRTQQVAFAVAPGRSLTLADGRRLGPGAEVRLSDFTYSAERGPAHAQLRRLIESWTVLMADDGPKAA